MIKDFDKFINEDFGMDVPGKVNHVSEVDSDSNMALGQLKRTKDFAEMLIPIGSGMEEMEPWVQSKITKAEDYLNAVLNYYKGQEGITEAKFTDYDNNELAAYIKNNPKDKEAAKELHKRSQKLKSLTRTDEGIMSEIDLLAKEAKDFKDFVKKFKKEYSDLTDAGDIKELESWLKTVYNDAKNESVTEAKIEVGTFVRYKKDKDFTGGKVISIKGSDVEIHNWDGSTSTLPLKDLEYVDSWNESINEAKVTKKSVSKASDDLAKIIIQLKDNLALLQSAKSDEDRAKYIAIAKDLTQQRKDASAALDLAIAKLDRNAELQAED